MNRLEQFMADDLARPAPGGLGPLVDAIRDRCGPALRAVVLYGSTRRDVGVGDGLVDLMAVVSGYRAVHGTGPTALLNHLLPPNVYYLEANAGAGPDDGNGAARVRCKYIIVSETSLARRMAGGLDGYFWARFTQPCRLVWRADDRAAELIARARARAARHFATVAAGLGPGRFTAEEFWVRAVRATYGCELRPEPPGAADALIGHDREFWQSLSETLLPIIPGIERSGEEFVVATGRARRLRGMLGWPARRIWSRTLNVLRLLKAAGTFANGIDYLSWKIERHSGVRIEPTERMRRHPRLAAWGLLFRLWKSGALR
ncbi:MAG: hypothetical protein RQ847_00340 [Wenzhouxiangellaceae bacterium]|nr:hypothetical protein [Wenzhouxiangellaceae bacterium]